MTVLNINVTIKVLLSFGILWHLLRFSLNKTFIGCDSLILEAYVRSEIGLKRTNNEDNLLFNGIIKEEKDGEFNKSEKLNLQEHTAVYGVFDGMGGYSKGERASFLTAKTARDIFFGSFGSTAEERLNAVVSMSNKIVREEIVKESNLKMGSTLSMLCFEGERFCLCDVGDSPIYIFRNGVLQKISLEHTEADVYRRIYGEEPPKDKKFPLTRHIGMPEDKFKLEPYLNSGEIFENDIFLICSDGLTDMVDDEDIAEIFRSAYSAAEMGDILVKKAIRNGGKDNITLVIVKVTGEKISRQKQLRSDSEDFAYDSQRKLLILKIAVGVILSVILIGLIVYGVAKSAEKGEEESAQISETSDRPSPDDNSVEIEI